MTPDQIVTIVVAVIGSGVLTATVTYFFGRGKTRAETESIAIKAANDTVTNLVPPLNARIDQLEKENCDLRTELQGQAITLDGLQERFLKLQLALSINESWARANNITLPITLARLEDMTIDAMRDIAYSVRNIEQRRRNPPGGDE